MGFTEKTGIPLVPDKVIRSMALGWLSAWTYDYRDPANFIRDTSTQIRNNADRILGEYLKQLRGSLSQFRQSFPSPTRENPFPPQELIEGAASLERYIREVEGVRTRVIGSSMPPVDVTRHSKSSTLDLLVQLREADKKMIELLSTVDESGIRKLNEHLDERDTLINEFASSLG